MSAPAFTPGPWQYLRSPSGPIRVGPSHNCTVAVAPFPPTGDQEANACLIAAAPDLYEALDRINVAACYASEEDTDAREAVLLHIGELARAALAKAQGAQS